METLKNAALGALIFPFFLLCIGTVGCLLFAGGFGIVALFTDEFGFRFIGGCSAMTVAVGAYIGASH